MSNETAIYNLIGTISNRDPRTYEALRLLLEDFYPVFYALYPPAGKKRDTSGAGVVRLGKVENFTATPFPNNLRLSWTLLSGAFNYEIRLGSSWDTGEILLTTSSSVADISPTEHNFIYGDYTFWIRPRSISGAYGDEASSCAFTVPIIPAPVITGTGVANSAILDWNEPVSTWAIDHYIVKQDGVPRGIVKSSFTVIPVLSAGTYGFTVQAVDIVGNLSAVSSIASLDLTDPINVVFLDKLDAHYDGTYSRTAKTTIGGAVGIIGAINDHTWEEHFLTRGWNTIQDQLDAGYPIYYQPSSPVPGSYIEVFDFGAVIDETNIVVNFSKVNLQGSTVVSCEIEYSTDGTTWSDPFLGLAVFADSVRYVRITLIFDNEDDHSAAFVSGLKVLLSVQQVIDSGTALCNASDVGGTLITYNKEFVEINSVTATAIVSLQPLYVTTDEVTKDNFKCLVFDSSGQRVDAIVGWKARGVV